MPNEKQAPLSQALLLAIRQHQNATDMMDMAVADLLGINRTDGICLDIIDQNGRMTAGQLAEAVELSTGTITAVIDRLEKAGYVRRVPDPDDRRKVLVEVTEQTTEISGHIYGRMMELGRALMGSMSEDEQRLVMRFLSTSTTMSREMAAALRVHVPPKPVSLEERLQRARSFERDQNGLIKRLIAELQDIKHPDDGAL